MGRTSTHECPGPGPRDWALVAVLVCWSVVEVVLRQDLAPRPLLLVYVLAVLGPLLWRRTHPLVAVAVSFGTLTILDIVRILTGSQGALLNSMSAALILAYALFRWGLVGKPQAASASSCSGCPSPTSPTP